MTVSSSRIRLVSLALALGLCFAASPLAAQSTSGSQPLQLFPLSPSQDDQGETQETQGVDQGQGVGGATNLPIPVEPVQKQSIQVDSLSTPAGGSLGLEDSLEAGLGGDPWRGLSLEAAIGALEALPSDLASPVLRQLIVRLLTSAAPPPASNLGPEESARRFMESRLAALFRLGALAEVSALSRLLPRALKTSQGLRLEVEAGLLEGNSGQACATVRQAVQLHGDDGYWARALIYCQLLADEINQALLGLELLQELDPDLSPLFALLALHMAGSDVDQLPQGEITPLIFVMMGGLLTPLPDDLPERLPDALMAAVALADNANANQRAWAAEKALAWGLLDAAPLRRAYAAMEFEAEDHAAALSRAQELGGSEGRALLFQVQQKQALEIARAQVLAALLAQARAEGELALARTLLAEEIIGTPITTDYTWFVGEAASLDWRDGRLERAKAWERLLLLPDNDAAMTQEALLRLWPTARLQNATNLAGSDLGLQQWSQSLAESAGDPQPEATPHPAALLSLLFDHLQLGGGLTWETLAQSGTLPRAEVIETAAYYSARSALRSQSSAAFVLALGRLTDVTGDLLILDLALEGLSRFELTEEARSLAFEALQRRGL